MEVDREIDDQASVNSESNESSTRTEIYKCPNYANTLFNQLQSLWINGVLCDVTLVAGNDGKKISAHKFILAIFSEYFAELFETSSQKEMKLLDSSQNVIELPSINGRDLEKLVEYCYTGSLESTSTYDVKSLLAASISLKFKVVVDVCTTQLINELSPTNCLELSKFGEEIVNLEILKAANSYTEKNFLRVCDHEMFLQLSESEITTLLNSDDLHISSEEDVFFALSKWVHYDKENREKCLANLLPVIRLQVLSPDFLLDQVSKLCENTLLCHKLILDALKWQFLPRHDAYFTNIWLPARKATLGNIILLGGLNSYDQKFEMDTYCPLMASWSYLSEILNKPAEFAVALLSPEKIITVGGRCGLNVLRLTQYFCLYNFRWFPLSPMNICRYGHSVVNVEGDIYAIGGHTGYSCTKTVECLSCSSGRWYNVAEMALDRTCFGAVTLNGKIFAVGGKNRAGSLKNVECYDPKHNEWSACAPMSIKRSNLGVAALNGFIYALGGLDITTTDYSMSRHDILEKYDPFSDSWVRMASLSYPRDDIAVCVLEDRLLAMGGFNGSEYLNVFEEYNPLTNSWKKLERLQKAVAAARVVVVDKNIFPK